MSTLFPFEEACIERDKAIRDYNNLLDENKALDDKNLEIMEKYNAKSDTVMLLIGEVNEFRAENKALKERLGKCEKMLHETGLIREANHKEK